MASLLATPTAARTLLHNSSGADAAFSLVPVSELDGRPAFASAWSDFDRDGDLDLAVSFVTGDFAIMRNDGVDFVAMPLPDLSGAADRQARALAWGDVNGDGWPDLFVASRARAYLMRNEAGSGFVEEAAERGLGRGAANPRQSTFVDFDDDGDVDLFVAERSGANTFYLNEGGHFVEAAQRLGLADLRKSVGACWFDYDRDGDLDLLVANQGGQSDALFRNDGTGFVDVAAQAGIDRSGRTSDDGSVGCALADFDNDGLMDIFVASYGHSPLYRNQGDGTFLDVSADVGIAIVGHNVAAAWGDIDLDGWQDLYIVGYSGEGNAAQPAGHLLRNRGGKFVLQPDWTAALNRGDHGIVFADVDGDGLLDASITQAYSSSSQFWLLRNRLLPDADARVLLVELHGSCGALRVAGATVRLFDARGVLLATRQTDTGGGYNAQGNTPAHFAVKAGHNYRVEAAYPGRGGARTISFGPLAIGGGPITHLVIQEPTVTGGVNCGEE